MNTVTRTERWVPGTLPSETTSFVGRQEETAAVRRLLRRSRLVTLVGVGGVGKTRLASQVARRSVRSFPDGIWFVDLAAVEYSALVVHTVADALELPDQSVRRPEDALVDHLAGKRALVVLDNCEHLVDACARLATTLLSSTTRVRMLVTSREPLIINGEQVFVVPPLTLPPVGEPGEHRSALSASPRLREALTLFATRARAVRRGFTVNRANEQVVTRLCQRLDGVPLAIELAAVRLGESSVEEILERLEQRSQLLAPGDSAVPKRQGTLRAAVEWSFDLCSPRERLLWERLSVFAGGFDLDAVEEVCAGEGLPRDALLPRAEVLDQLAGLVNKSVLIATRQEPHVGYRLLETIREFGRQRLREAGEEAVLRLRHRDYYVGLAARADAEWFGRDQLQWLRRLSEAQANLRAALDYTLTESGEAVAGLRMTAALGTTWIASGRVREGRHWLDQACSAETAPSRELARALWMNGWISLTQGDIPHALAVLEKSRKVALEIGDENALAHVAHLIGAAETFLGNVPRAVELTEQGLARHRVTGERNAHVLIGYCRTGWAVCLAGDLDRARALCEEGEAICQADGEQWTLSWLRWVRGLVLWTGGEVCAATALVRTSLRQKWIFHDQLGIPFCVELLAWAAAREGRGELAARLLGAVEKMWQHIGGALFGSFDLLGWHDECLGQVRRALGDEAFDAAYRSGGGLTTEEAVSAALGEAVASPEEVR